MQSELLDVVTKTTRCLNESNLLSVQGAPLAGLNVPQMRLTNGDSRLDGDADGSQQQHPLPELLEALLERFRRIAAAHAFVLRRLAASAEKRNYQIRLYEMNVVWSTIQAVVSNLCTRTLRKLGSPARWRCIRNEMGAQCFRYLRRFSLLIQMQLILTDYLDIQNLATDPNQPPSSFSEPNSDLSLYFLRRRPHR